MYIYYIYVYIYIYYMHVFYIWKNLLYSDYLSIYLLHMLLCPYMELFHVHYDIVYYNKLILSSLYVCMATKYITVLFVETPRKFITAKLSIRKPGSSSVLIICDLFNSLIKSYMQKCRDLLARVI
jgi:hypothetical protein